MIQVNVLRYTGENIEKQYESFVKHVDIILNTNPADFNKLSYQELYGAFFNVFFNCGKIQRESLDNKCIEYLKQKCEIVSHPTMVALYDVLLYFRKNNENGQRVLNDLLDNAKTKNRTLMELCLLEIDKHPELKKQLNKSQREQLEYRIKKYYFD